MERGVDIGEARDELDIEFLSEKETRMGRESEEK